MEYDYNAYCGRFDLGTASGIHDLLTSALRDWQEDLVTDQQFGDLVARANQSLAAVA